MTDAELLGKIASKVLQEEVPYNDNYLVRPWSHSVMDKELQKLPEKINRSLTDDATLRAVEWSRTYRWYGHKYFESLLPFYYERVEDYREAKDKARGAKSPDKKKAARREQYAALVDICAFGMLHIGGQRIGDKQIDVRGFLLRRKK
jgi:hypothetical protein